MIYRIEVYLKGFLFVRVCVSAAEKSFSASSTFSMPWGAKERETEKKREDRSVICRSDCNWLIVGCRGHSITDASAQYWKKTGVWGRGEGE